MYMLLSKRLFGDGGRDATLDPHFTGRITRLDLLHAFRRLDIGLNDPSQMEDLIEFFEWDDEGTIGEIDFITTLKDAVKEARERDMPREDTGNGGASSGKAPYRRSPADSTLYSAENPRWWLRPPYEDMEYIPRFDLMPHDSADDDDIHSQKKYYGPSSSARPLHVVRPLSPHAKETKSPGWILYDEKQRKKMMEQEERASRLVNVLRVYIFLCAKLTSP